MFRKMPFILFAMIVLIAICYPWIPSVLQSILYGISLSLKSLIVFILPFLIFGLLFKTSVQLAKKASKWILLVLGAVCLSNFLSTMLSFLVGNFAYQLDLSMPLPVEQNGLQPLASLTLPSLVKNSHAMFSALLLGILLGWLKPRFAEKIGIYLEKGIHTFLQGFLLIIPLFIAGFVIKMLHDGVLNHIISNYAKVFALVAAAVFSYISLLYLIINRFQLKPFIESLKNMLPAAIAGFGSMSSAASMPLTILATEKNAKDPALARSLIPMTVNIHLIGDCFAIPIFAFAILKGFGVSDPTFIQYVIFALYFVLAKFSVAAVPGGGILVMLPILEQYLGFNGEMLSLITALYILFDPLITAANVAGNGAFAIGVDRLLYQSIGSKKI